MLTSLKLHVFTSRQADIFFLNIYLWLLTRLNTNWKTNFSLKMKLFRLFHPRCRARQISLVSAPWCSSPELTRTPSLFIFNQIAFLLWCTDESLKHSNILFMVVQKVFVEISWSCACHTTPEFDGFAIKKTFHLKICRELFDTWIYGLFNAETTPTFIYQDFTGLNSRKLQLKL